MKAKLLTVVGGTTARSLPDLHRLDPHIVLQAQEYVQLALGSLLQAQGYRGDETLGQLVDAWLASCCRLSKTTTYGYRRNAVAFMRELARLRPGHEQDLVEARTDEELEELGRALPLAELTLEHIERAIDRVSSGRWNSVTTCLRAAFAWGNRRGFAGVGMLRPAARRHQARPPVLPKGAWAQAAHLLYDAFEAARPRSRAAAAAALCSVRWGVRRGAVARLEWSQIAGNEIRLADKGRARIVVLDELDQAILAELPRRGPWCDKDGVAHDYVFPGPGGHVEPSSVSKLSCRVLRPKGLDMTLHQAGRHAAGATILDLGGSTGDAAAQLGHANDDITRKRYLPAVTEGSQARRARGLLREAYDEAASPWRDTAASARRLAKTRAAEDVRGRVHLEGGPCGRAGSSARCPTSNPAGVTCARCRNTKAFKRLARPPGVAEPIPAGDDER